jgi:hypothetical protein
MFSRARRILVVQKEVDRVRVFDLDQSVGAHKQSVWRSEDPGYCPDQPSPTAQP